MMKEDIAPASALITAMGGPLIWAAHFAILYASQTLVCQLAAAASQRTYMVGIGAASTVAAALAMLWLIRQPQRAGGPVTSHGRTPALLFLRSLTFALVGLSLLAILWSLYVLLALPPCTPVAA
jgi:hypothetical protein